MAWPAFAADWDARAIRTRALGETGRASSFARGVAALASIAFFFAPTFAGAGLAGMVLGGALASSGAGSVLFTAEGRIEEEILFSGLLLRDEDFAMD